jgi:hypothetical protein
MDQYNDPANARLKALLDRHPAAADRVKTAEIEDDVADLPDGAFADSARRLYPIHTEPQAIVSYLFAKQASANGAVLGEISRALEVFDVPPDVFHPVTVKEAALEEDECLFPEERLYPVRNAAEVKTAEMRLLAQTSKLSPEARGDAYSRLYKKASQYGVALTTMSYKYAGATMTDPMELARTLEARAMATKSADISEGFRKLASSVRASKRQLEAQETRAKVAAAIFDLDLRGGVVPLYDRGVLHPHLAVYNTTKLADGEMVDLGDRQVPVADLQRVDEGFWSQVLGNDVIAEIAPTGTVEPNLLTTVLTTLPADLKKTVSTALRSAGV